jgi:hypothetical protein
MRRGVTRGETARQNLRFFHANGDIGTLYPQRALPARDLSDTGFSPRAIPSRSHRTMLAVLATCKADHYSIPARAIAPHVFCRNPVRRQTQHVGDLGDKPPDVDGGREKLEILFFDVFEVRAPNLGYLSQPLKSDSLQQPRSLQRWSIESRDGLREIGPG